jgi:hypothetical protein
LDKLRKARGLYQEIIASPADTADNGSDLGSANRIARTGVESLNSQIEKEMVANEVGTEAIPPTSPAP